MTNAVKTELKRMAKTAMKENGLKALQKDMILLECSYHYETVFDMKIIIVDYVMFEDRKTRKQYQCRYGAKHYNPELDTLYSVDEYNAA